MSLTEMLALVAKDRDADSPKILPEAALMQLREAAARYARGALIAEAHKIFSTPVKIAAE